MRVLFAGHKERGVECLRELLKSKHDVVGVIAHPENKTSFVDSSVADLASKSKIPLFRPQDINDPSFIRTISKLKPELGAFSGYSQVLKREFVHLFPKGCLNLHGGKLPEYRGSSPMNWALINGEKEFGISVIQVNEGVDAGPVVVAKKFPIKINDTIVDLHRIANQAFPKMLAGAINQIAAGKAKFKKQNEKLASYYPLRFPEDGLIVWDLFSAIQIHNRIRALTAPYPCAFTYWNGEKIKLLRSKLTKQTRYGEPGRIYLKNQNGLLVCALDHCLWIEKAIFEKDGSDVLGAIQRYEKLITARDTAAKSLLPAESFAGQS